MPVRLLIACFFSTLSLLAAGQISLKDPQICHDREGYLKSFYDGSYRLSFEKGKFISFSDVDGTLIYSDTNKVLKFYPAYPVGMPKDTVQIKLLQHSILLTRGNLKKEFTSLPDSVYGIYDFQMGTYTVDGKGSGFTLWAGSDKDVRITVSTWGKSWSWDMVIKKGPQTMWISYNGYRKNRMEYIGIIDDSLRHGMSVSTRFRTLKKVSRLRSFYSEVATINGEQIVRGIQADHPYLYLYKKNGRIKKKKTFGDIKLCSEE